MNQNHCWEWHEFKGQFIKLLNYSSGLGFFLRLCFSIFLHLISTKINLHLFIIYIGLLKVILLTYFLDLWFIEFDTIPLLCWRFLGENQPCYKINVISYFTSLTEVAWVMSQISPYTGQQVNGQITLWVWIVTWLRDKIQTPDCKIPLTLDNQTQHFFHTVTPFKYKLTECGNMWVTNWPVLNVGGQR